MGTFIFIIAVLNNVIMAAVFIVRLKGETRLAKVLGIAYLTLALPAAAALAISIAQGAAAETIIFLLIFLAFLFVEWLFDFKLKLNFRKEVKFLVPYLVLYYASCYGLFVITWRISTLLGSIVLGLTLAQFAVNMITHRKRK